MEETPNNLNEFQNTDQDPSPDKFKNGIQDCSFKKQEPPTEQKNDSMIEYAQTPKFTCESGNIRK